MGAAQDMGLLKEGDLVIQTAGTLTGISGSTDLVKVGIVSAVLAKGSGIGNGTVSGKVRLALTPGDSSKIEPGGDPGDADDDGRRSRCDPPRRRNRDGSSGRNVPRFRYCAAPRDPSHIRGGQRHRDLRHGEVVTLQVRDGLVHRGTGLDAGVEAGHNALRSARGHFHEQTDASDGDGEDGV